MFLRKTRYEKARKRYKKRRFLDRRSWPERLADGLQEYVKPDR